MNAELRCNIIQCRKRLITKAIITACSHAFCSDCATKSFSHALVCPACENPLSDVKDISLADVKPTDEWKSLVLAGQCPEVILDISSRAISFWSYQMHQEQVYVEMAMKEVQEKWAATERFYQNTIVQLKGEISTLSDKCTEQGKQMEEQKRREAETVEQVVEKTRQLKKLQSLCDRLRKKETLALEPGIPEWELDNNFYSAKFPSVPITDLTRPTWLSKWNNKASIAEQTLPQITPTSQSNFKRRTTRHKKD